MGKKRDDADLCYVDYLSQVRMLGYSHSLQRCLLRKQRRGRILRWLRIAAAMPSALGILVWWLC